MKYSLLTLAGITLGLIVGLNIPNHPDFEERMTMVRNSSQFGCYQGTIIAANTISDENKRLDLYDKALYECPIVAKHLEEFIRNGKK